METTITKEMLDKLSQRLSDEGKIIEAGWVALRLMAIPLDAGEIQVNEMRKAFMAGAQHLWASINSILEPGAEPTDKDMKRMTLIHEELLAFYNELKSGMI